jgi:hypothetical protein
MYHGKRGTIQSRPAAGAPTNAEIRVIRVACGLLCCPQITQKTQMNPYSKTLNPLYLRSSAVPQENHAWERFVPGSPCPQIPGRNRDNRDRIQLQ